MAGRKKAPRLFAAIDVGSFELCMKIFEVSAKGLRQIDSIRHRLALGTDSYTTHKISYEKMEELFRILQEFTQIMKTYRVKDYQAYGTSALRETENTQLLLDQIRNRSGISLDILSNSEQRFLDYKAIASRGEQFNKIIEKGTAIVDIGGGNIQLSLFDKGSLIITQSLKLGVLRLHERMQNIQPRSSQVEALLDEMIGGQLHVFRKIYMKDREICNLIVMDDYLSGRFGAAVTAADEKGEVSAEDFLAFVSALQEEGREEVADRLEMEEESVDLLKISAGIMKRVTEAFGAEMIWAPGASLCDGIAYEYVERQQFKNAERDFEQDIIACAGTISKRYQGSHKRSEAIERIAVAIFDGMRSAHGMGEREKLLLRLAAILHDCGKFINMTNVGECSHAIIMNTEIIGLSHLERSMVADIVKYNHTAFDYVDDAPGALTVAKLTAILRIANALDKSQKQKVTGVQAVLKDDKLLITVDAGQDLLFEQERFRMHAAFFEEVYGIRPVIKHNG